MYYNLISFPFSSMNDNNYTLVLCLNSNGDFEEVNKILAADRELFKQKSTQLVSGDTVYNWEGTLTGLVKAVDDERDDTWTPLVCSKLSFNMAVSEFPAWLMDFCTNNRAKVILYYNEGLLKHEMWRGYLVAQTLNMTVVNKLLSCPLVACDEVAMAKYMNFRDTIDWVTNDHWNSIFGLMQHFHTLHHTRGLSSVSPGFEKLYTILGLSHSNRLFWHRNMRVFDDDGNAVNNLPDLLIVNLDRWMQLDDEGKSETTWEDVFNDVLEYLGVTFAVGSWGLMTVNDAYILANPTDSASVQQFVEIFDSGNVTSHSTSMYATLTNPQKVGANLQISSEPDKYNKVKLTSEPERWETHEYLTDEHYKEIDKSKSVRYEWGEGGLSNPSELQEYGFHKLIYLKPDSKENDYLNIPPCADGEGYLMARNGELPYDDLDSCTGLTEPDASCADSLDFITFKEGCCCVKIGSGNIGGIDENKLLSSYFLIMNHMWGNMWGGSLHSMQSEHLADTPWLILRPFRDQMPIHPSEKHYLKIKVNLKFVRENMPSDISGTRQKRLWLKEVAPNPPVNIYWDTTPAIILPQEETLYDFSDPNSEFYAGTQWPNLYIYSYIKIGKFYYNGSQWVYINTGETPPKCSIRLWNDSNEIVRVLTNGLYSINTKNYYFTISNPYSNINIVDKYTNQSAMFSNVEGASIHGQPMHGNVEIQILGQIRFQSSPAGHNSIPFVLINDIDINYTDEAELIGTEIDNKVELTMDAVSTTKETLEKSLNMATPSVDGFFNNVLLYDGGKAWHNLTHVRPQTTADIMTPEQLVAMHLANQYSASQLFVELETPVQFDTNVHNVCFRVSGLTEAEGSFLPVKRTFDYTKETLRVKLMRVNTMPSD